MEEQATQLTNSPQKILKENLKASKSKFSFLHELCVKNKWTLDSSIEHDAYGYWLCELTLKFDG